MLSAAILAGGRAIRFGGRDKGSLVIGGRTIFDRQVSELSQIAEEIVIVGHTTTRPGVRALADLIPHRGPLGGLHTALSAARSDVTVVVACDMPYVSAAFLAYLARLAADVDAVVPVTERGYHPLCAAYTRGAIEPIARRLAAGRLKMAELIADIRLRVVTAEEVGRFGDQHRLLANVNTPPEYDNLEALHAHAVSS
jgi:molybdopterin-guanine dinucleotide biosynthesis protein A